MTIIRFRQPDPAPTPTPQTVACGVSVSVGDLVYISPTGLLQKAKASSKNTMPAVGIVTEKPSSNTCIIEQHFFLSKTSVNKTEYFVSPTTAGQMTDTHPEDPGNVVQKVGQGFGTDMRKIDIEPNTYIVRT